MSAEKDKIYKIIAENTAVRTSAIGIAELERPAPGYRLTCRRLGRGLPGSSEAPV